MANYSDQVMLIPKLDHRYRSTTESRHENSEVPFRIGSTVNKGDVLCDCHMITLQEKIIFFSLDSKVVTGKFISPAGGVLVWVNSPSNFCVPEYPNINVENFAILLTEYESNVARANKPTVYDVYREFFSNAEYHYDDIYGSYGGSREHMSLSAVCRIPNIAFDTALEVLSVQEYLQRIEKRPQRYKEPVVRELARHHSL